MVTYQPALTDYARLNLNDNKHFKYINNVITMSDKHENNF